MKKTNHTPYFILNPNSGGGRAAREWKRIEPLLPQFFASTQIHKTKKSGDAVLMAKKAALQGYRQIVSVGGDGTLNEVLNGIMQVPAEIRQNISLSLFPLGSGDDFAKTLLWPKDFKQRLQGILRNQGQKVDVGLIHYQDFKGKKLRRYFLNICDFGMGGEVVARVNRSSKLFGGKITYLTSILETLMNFKPFSIEASLEGKKRKFHDITLGIIANGSYFGGGLCVAPQAKLDNGLFEVLLVEKMAALDFLKLLPQLYLRRALSVKGIHSFQSSFISVKSLQAPSILLDCDGEQPGILPASFELLPQELRVTVL
ncbi:MAG: diacylglycerol kinase family lipid kinase [Deltaproteobacteria bacterium]|nr:diacylglycerol kinase family lipid kinase [Deltaproteobacteria bacterium]